MTLFYRGKIIFELKKHREHGFMLVGITGKYYNTVYACNSLKHVNTAPYDVFFDSVIQVLSDLKLLDRYDLFEVIIKPKSRGED